jgi:hypothetical protein
MRPRPISRIGCLLIGTLDSAEDNKRDDIWVANFMSRLTGTLRNIASRRQK